MPTAFLPAVSALRAIAEPTRLRLLALLARAELTVGEICEVLGQSQPRVSRHLKLLCDARLLDRFREQHWVYYRAPAAGAARETVRQLLARVAESDCLGRTGDFDCSGIRWFAERARALGVEHAAPDPIVKGRHLLGLGVPPGPGMGRLLKEVYERQLDGRVTTLDEGLAVARELLQS